MNAADYSWYRPEFPTYNVAQAAVIPFCDQDVNMVVCFGTAVGKSVVAECAFGYHLSQGSKVAFVAPYRSLCNEKFAKWTDDVFLNMDGVVIRTGEMRSREAIEMEAGLSVLTAESFDVRTRSTDYWEDWIRSLSCVVYDEAHMLGDPERGAAIEASLVRLSAVNPTCRLILLSATMDNAVEVAKWVKSLNGKVTKCFTSTWSPSKVVLEEVVAESKSAMIDEAIELAGKGGKTVIFVHSKQVGRDIVKKLKARKVKSAFHNASLSKEKRSVIESLFRSPDSGLDIIVSTSTLGAGVNLAV
jgi:helicase